MKLETIEKANKLIKQLEVLKKRLETVNEILKRTSKYQNEDVRMRVNIGAYNSIDISFDSQTIIQSFTLESALVQRKIDQKQKELDSLTD